MENALVILCGGNSTRMGTDKALLPFGDTCLIEYLVRKFQPYFSRIYLSVKIKGDYSHLKLPVTEIPVSIRIRDQCPAFFPAYP